MKIMILCGGRGRRLGPLTEEVPKPLAPFRGRTILDLKVEDYLAQGHNDFIVCLGYKGELVREALSVHEAKGARFEYSDAGEDAGMLQRVWEARDLFDDRVFLTYGDTFADINVESVADTHESGDWLATIVSAPVESPFGLVTFDRDNRGLSFREKPTLSYYIGQAVLEKSAFEKMPPRVTSMPDGEGLVTFFKVLIALERLGVHHHDGLEITFNTREELASAEEKLLRFYTGVEGSA